MRITAIEITYTTSSGGNTPSISASDVNIEYDATEGSIAYTLDNATGNVSASITTGNWLELGTITASAVPFTCSANTGAERTATVKLSFTGATDKVVTITQAAAPTPTISANNVNIAYNATGGSIAYTVNNPVSGGTLTAAIKAGTTSTIESFAFGTITNTTVPFTCAANSTATAHTATVTLTYTYNTNQTVTKDVTITQAAAPVIYTTIPEIFNAASSTSTNVNVTFGNWVVSGVSGSNAFVTDNSGNGFIIYTSNHGFAVNDKLSGTVMGTPMKLYKGSAEFTNLLKTTSGLAVSNDGAITVITGKTISNLGGVNTGAVITLNNLRYDGTNLSDGTNTIKPYNSLYSGMSFTNGKIYNVTGVYQQFDNTKEILPRSANDIVEVVSPIINAENVALDYNATSGEIEYSITNAVNNGSISASVQSGDWLTNPVCSTTENKVTFTATSNTSTTPREGVIRITYTYNTNETVYKDVTITQATFAITGTINFNNTSSGIAINDDEVTGDDNLGNIWTITTEGTTSFTANSAYYQVGSGNSPATSITFTTTLPNEVVITDFSAKFGGFNGTVGAVSLKVGTTEIGSGSLNGSSDVVVENATSAAGTVLTVTVTDIDKGVKCYYISYSFSAGTDPMIVAQNSIVLSSTDTYGEFAYSIVNPASGVNLSASSTADWISNINVTTEKVTFQTTQNTSLTDNREGTITLSYTGATDKNISVTQSKVDYATLPFSFDGGKDELPTGLSGTLSGDYNASPKLGFRDTDNNLILKLNEAPVSIIYDIKGNSFSGGTFKVQVSENGIDYTDIKEYTKLGNVQTDTLINTNDDVRYIKWIYTNKSNGNVALGNIKVYDVEFIYVNNSTTMNDLTIEDKKAYVVKSGVVLTLTGTVTNTAPGNLIIQDGGQLKTSNAVHGTIQKNIVGYGDANNNTNVGYYLLKSPVSGTLTLAQAIAAGMVNGTVETPNYTGIDFYWFQQGGSDNAGDDAEWRNAQANNILTGSGLPTMRAYLYANKNDVTLNFATSEGKTFPATTTDISVQAQRNKDNSLRFPGWNLIGNPFTCNAYLRSGRDFYRMNDDGNGIVLATDNVIKPCEGIFVVIEENDVETFINTSNYVMANVYFTTTEPTTQGKGKLDVTVSHNNAISDAARIRFDRGERTGKMILNPNATRISLAQEGQDYSVVHMEGEGELPVNFKAAENGTYTISVDVENIDMDYLHLIDNKTGSDVDLLVTPSYTFEGKRSDYASRFKLVFNANNENENANENFAFISNGEIIVNGTGTIQVIDMLGHVLLTREANSAFRIPHSEFAPGVYLLRLVDGENVRTQKIVVR